MNYKNVCSAVCAIYDNIHECVPTSGYYGSVSLDVGIASQLNRWSLWYRVTERHRGVRLHFFNKHKTPRMKIQFIFQCKHISLPRPIQPLWILHTLYPHRHKDLLRRRDGESNWLVLEPMNLRLLKHISQDWLFKGDCCIVRPLYWGETASDGRMFRYGNRCPKPVLCFHDNLK
jgi:hypothetical protein